MIEIQIDPDHIPDDHERATGETELALEIRQAIEEGSIGRKLELSNDTVSVSRTSSNQSSETSPDLLTVHASEPAWVSTEYNLTADGSIEIAGEPTVGDSVESVFDAAFYELEDGTVLDSWWEIERLSDYISNGRDLGTFLWANGHLEVDDALVPLFEESRHWFESYGTLDQYNMTAGGSGFIERLTPSGVTFAWVNNLDPASWYPDRRDNFESLVNKSENNTAVAADKSEAMEIVHRENCPATWKNTTHCGDLEIFEYVPFETQVTTLSELREELDRILDVQLNYNELFEEAESVAEGVV